MKLSRIATELGLPEAATTEEVVARIYEWCGDARPVGPDRIERNVMRVIRLGLLSPAMFSWAVTCAERTPDVFTSFLDHAPRVSPPELAPRTAADVIASIAGARVSASGGTLNFGTALLAVTREEPWLAEQALRERRGGSR